MLWIDSLMLPGHRKEWIVWLDKHEIIEINAYLCRKGKEILELADASRGQVKVLFVHAVCRVRHWPSLVQLTS